MNILEKTKLIKNFINLANITKQCYKKDKEKVKDALWFFEQYIREARPYIEEIRNILKNDK